MAWARTKSKAHAAPTADEGKPPLEATRLKEEVSAAASSASAEAASQMTPTEAQQLEAQEAYAT
eukprot:9278589-Lingulodinium_polyedra.AAC.1